MKPIIGFAGMGHLGQHSAAAAYAKGFQRVTYTPGKTGDHPEDLRECDIVYISPDRPGSTSPEAMVELVLPYLKYDAIVVILCQVTPGFTRQVKWPKHLLYYQVETLRMSDAEERALFPERIILGAIGTLVDLRLEEFLESFKCPVFVMSYESAELSKIALNIYLAAQVSVTNTLSEIGEKIGADWNQIIPALKTDKRIGPHAYLHPGYGLSGHLERDLKEIMLISGNTSVIRALYHHSEYRRMLGDSMKPKEKIDVLV